MFPTWSRFTDRHPRLVEAALLLLVTAVTSRQHAGAAHGWAAGQPLVAAALVPLLWRRRHPGPVVVATAVCGAASAGLGYPLSLPLLAPSVLALYELAVRAPQRTVYAHYALVLAMVVPVALLAENEGQDWAEESVGPVFWLLLPVLAGIAVQARRAYLDAVHLRAEHAERTREEEARRRVAEERVRIARELHDVVAHHMALAHAQAGTAARLARTRPDQAGEILGELTGTTSAALRELQATVGLLRQPGDPEGPDGPDGPGLPGGSGEPLEPAPGLDRLPELVAAFASAGLPVSVAAEGAERPLPPGLDLTAYRIVQEALTNVAKHAGAGKARVRLAYAHDRLTVSVSDDGGAGRPPPPPGGGFGLIGMRERARTAGGSLRAGPRPDGGFTVTAELPLPVRQEPPVPPVPGQPTEQTTEQTTEPSGDPR
ncbi:sensor histidine kinase [Streptomyces sp. CMB-StM0423]|uniref:sensor histidine kinase n=1 Tax=Streptomyces sp. CMB-StM0423 TaxID=2059884 RepID=UPI000C700933|nr:histidine kinase [Streptomyces sp. CMB-StM0423]AUH40623.1 two-component sensor histidine kinase [Streptomyces sp. CMB-StM0423]